MKNYSQGESCLGRSNPGRSLIYENQLQHQDKEGLYMEVKTECL